MGAIADNLLDGTFDSVTREYLGVGPGYPRTIKNGKIVPYTPHPTKRKVTPRRKIGRITNCSELNGIMKFFNGYKCFKDEKEAYDFIKNYCENRLRFSGTINECAKIIQKNFGHFTKYTKEQKIYISKKDGQTADNSVPSSKD